jgi:hypothetical protein
LHPDKGYPRLQGEQRNDAGPEVGDSSDSEALIRGDAEAAHAAQLRDKQATPGDAQVTRAPTACANLSPTHLRVLLELLPDTAPKAAVMVELEECGAVRREWFKDRGDDAFRVLLTPAGDELVNALVTTARGRL